MFLILYLMALAALLLHAPPDLLDPANRPFFVVIGVIGIWRYGWGAVHFLRAQYYKRIEFRGLRRRATALLPAPAADSADETRAGPEVFIVVTSFRIRAETTATVYRGAIAEACRHDGPAVIVASIVEMADQRFIKQLFYSMAPPEHVRLIFVRTAGLGKRHGLAVALRAVARSRPANDAVVALVDGDTVLIPGTFERCLPFFRLLPEIGALTTDEEPVIQSGALLRQWYMLRFAQRQLLMCSMGLSRRLLTLTGRMSFFRVRIATDPSFVDTLRDDSIEHWRLGRIPLLTGDDKSTWFWLLQRNWDMLYVPDVRILTLEDPPNGRFLIATTRLMRRWFGNMLRASGRAIALGPRRVGLFPWWCLIDQRVSMWTPLLLPLSALALTLATGPTVLYAYAIWVMTTRLLQSLLLLGVRDRIGTLFPLLILYSQVYGAMVKTWVLFHPHRQSWTRQGIVAPAPAGISGRLQAALSHYTHALAMLALILAVAVFTGLIETPSPRTVALTLARLF
ncbi:MAG TPA: glycosyltransferase [Geminicoccaceae bacterium]|nr:glycosyltransferase [Geminicoccaceae bacterium]